MKLMEFFNEARSLGADRNDPLLSIVKNLTDEKAHLVELRRQTQGYLMPVTTKGGKTSIISDPDLSEDVADLAAQIEASKARIADLEERIADVDKITARHHIERPLLREMRRELNEAQTGIVRYRKRASATLGHLLLINGFEEEDAKEHRDYIKAVADFEKRKQQLEPKIQNLDSALAEIQAVISNGN